MKNSFLTHVPPMGIYETLYAFQNAFGTYMGEKGTHPWSQGFLNSSIEGNLSPHHSLLSQQGLTSPNY